MNTTLILLVLALSVALIVLVRRGQRPVEPPAPAPVPAEDLEVEIAVASNRTRGVPLEVTKARRVHRSELLPRVERSVAPLRLHVAFNSERGMYQVWAGARRFDDAPAHLRAERTTEVGALRCLLNLSGAPRGTFWLLENRPKRQRRKKPRIAIVKVRAA